MSNLDPDALSQTMDPINGRRRLPPISRNLTPAVASSTSSGQPATPLSDVVAPSVASNTDRPAESNSSLLPVIEEEKEEVKKNKQSVSLTPGVRKFFKSELDDKERNEKMEKIVEIDVPTSGTKKFKTYQVPLDQLPKDLTIINKDKITSEGLMTVSGPQIKKESDKLIQNKIDAIYQKYITDQVNKSAQSNDGKRSLRITYNKTDYLVDIRPMKKIPEIIKAIEEQKTVNEASGKKSFDKIASYKTNERTAPLKKSPLEMSVEELDKEIQTIRNKPPVDITSTYNQQKNRNEDIAFLEKIKKEKEPKKGGYTAKKTKKNNKTKKSTQRSS